MASSLPVHETSELMFCLVKYLSHATSTFILKIHRAHYRLVWAALTLMDRVPVKNGEPCTFRVVRVSGTIRKVEEEAVRRARQLILAAKDAAAAQHKPTILAARFDAAELSKPADSTALVVDSGSDANDMESDDG